MPKKFFEDRRPHNGMKYNEYLDYFKNKLEENFDEHIKLNFQRTNRIHKIYQIDNELKNIILRINSNQIWMVLTEAWCGDSAQSLPYIAIFAEQNPKIDLRILLRDSNLDIMDQYLTGTSRSIPKLISFDLDGNELFQWGPRPKKAQELIAKLRDEGIPKEKYLEELHKWYANDKGKSIEEEFKKILSKFSA
ncbi:thioredoxin family protein [Melioribacteraceae bacterium 4301-Me]|uniref:thioredoxin family protein n=1 Tax=Pyranulibacter aquaticus TaxID=3163344 RepID=UPI00359A0879